ncbi:type I restriction-modification system endonuclease [Hymenobacter nivis]|uniref:type I restriction-modification system endonuclease n=1 Tax=Hymenobacter nivis TaxID=1850093 RepID=UPI0013A53A15|nr:type I restriction-modification system endonuclease [Hymenobacter nivis]
MSNSTTSNFDFLRDDFPTLYSLGTEAEFQLHHDAVAALFKLRLFGEKLVDRLFAEHQLPPLVENTQHRRLEELKRQGLLPRQVEDILQLFKRKGNVAAHQNVGSFADATILLESAYHLGKWVADAYSAMGAANPPPFLLPEPRNTAQELAQLEAEKQTLQARVVELEASLTARPELTAPARLQLQEKAQKAADNIHLSEAETRAIIDEQLRAAGWEADTQVLCYGKGTRPQKGRNLAIAEWSTEWNGEKGRADYALFAGMTLVGMVEAKRINKDVSGALVQSKRYSKGFKPTVGVELLNGAPWGDYQAPFLFSANGRQLHYQLPEKSGIWFLDGRNPINHPRPLHKWYTPEGLLALHAQDVAAAEAKLLADPFDYLRDPHGLGLRSYQIEAIEQVEATLAQHTPERRALLAMATGTGKTRTMLGLIYRLIKSDRFRRILFLVDRNVLGTQATDAFNDVYVEGFQALKDIYDLKGLEEKLPEKDTRLHVATVQSLVKRLYYSAEGVTPLPVDTYDCIIVDEAHRGYTLDKSMSDEQVDFKDQLDYLSKYRAVLDYFDAARIGLTATPALHTVEIFGLPVFRYTYRQAVIDGYLIDHEPPILLRTALNQHGIVWEAGSTPQVYNPATQSIEDLDTLADELRIEIDGFNQQVLTEPFNRTIAGELINYLDPAGPQKTLIFAANDEHADLLVLKLTEAYEQAGILVDDDAIVKITAKADKPQQLVKKFKNEQYPSIVVTVDLLTTGVDIPSICNLVFMRRVKSRILYEQMLGRATRRDDDNGKSVFRIFDAVRLYEALEKVTTMKPVVANPGQSVADLLAELPNIHSEAALQEQVEQIVAMLHRKRNKLSNAQAENVYTSTSGRTLTDFLAQVRTLPPAEAGALLSQHQAALIDASAVQSRKTRILVSTQEDVALNHERGYGGIAQRPEDYLHDFEEFVKTNQNSIEALKIICTEPQNITRAMLREVKQALDAEGFNAVQLNTAWREVKKQELGADIIAYVRTMSLGTAARPLTERVKDAIDHVRFLRNWNVHQLKFLDRVQKQLLRETILTRTDLDQEPFRSGGGFTQYNKLMGGNLDDLLHTIQEKLYPSMTAA